MNKLNKYIVPVNLIVYGEDEDDAIGYVTDAVDHSAIIQEDGIIGADILDDDVEFIGEEDDDDNISDE